MLFSFHDLIEIQTHSPIFPSIIFFFASLSPEWPWEDGGLILLQTRGGGSSIFFRTYYSTAHYCNNQITSPSTHDSRNHDHGRDGSLISFLTYFVFRISFSMSNRGEGWNLSEQRKDLQELQWRKKKKRKKDERLWRGVGR